jgi:DNA-directed RNA polymerase specialized sigma24 family protein
MAEKREKINAEIARIVSAVQGMPDLVRQVFTLRRVYGFSHPQIAAHLHISAVDVEINLVTAAKGIADALDAVSPWFDTGPNAQSQHANAGTVLDIPT